MHSQEFQDLRASGAESLYPNSPVRFDTERLLIRAAYSDQLSAYRARRLWNDAFEGQFLLDAEHDFRIEVTSNLNEHTFSLNCEFLTACGRYAFWRLTHNQAPDIQYLVETAHIPSTAINLPVPLGQLGEGGEHLPSIMGSWPPAISHTFSLKAIFNRFLAWCQESRNGRGF